MAEFKIVISDKGKSMQKEVKEAAAAQFMGKKIGEKVGGDAFELTGYEFEITGGSDHCGFPMRKDVNGTKRKKILSISGVGLHVKKKGNRIRKTVAGNTVHERTAQINLKVLKAGAGNLFEATAPEGETPKEEKPAKEEKKPAKEKKEKAPAEEPKAEEKKEESKPEKAPAEENKEEPAAEEKKE